MSAPTHHLDDAVLLDYVTGTATEPVALVVACHLTLCAACRERSTAAEAVGGAVLEQAHASSLSDGALDRLFARLDTTSAATDSAPIADSDQPFVFAGIPLPRPLAHYLAPEHRADQSTPAFRFLAPGVRGIDLPVTASAVVRTRLLRLAPGVEIPRHSHGAPEFTLVFSGGLSDDGQHYGRGDVRFRDAAAIHTQRVDSPEPCVALVVNEGSLDPQTLRGKLVSLLFDR